MESLTAFVPAVYGFALFVEPRAAAALGGVFVVGRILFGLGYKSPDPKARAWGFKLSALASSALLLGTIAGVGRFLFLRYTK